MKGDIATCPNCGKPFEQRRKDQQFCNGRCRYEYWNKAHPRIGVNRPFLEVVQEISEAQNR